MQKSRESELLEKCAENLEIDMHYSQVLFQFDQQEKPLDKARQIVEKLGINIVDTKIFDFPEWRISYLEFFMDREKR